MKTKSKLTNLVIPAKAGVQSWIVTALRAAWIPAFAGKTARLPLIAALLLGLTGNAALAQTPALVNSAPMPFAAGANPRSVAVGDLNGDGKFDIAAIADDKVALLLGDGGGSFAAPITLDLGFVPRAVALGDFNGDGLPDVVTVNNADTTVSVLINITAPGAGMLNFSAPQGFAGSTSYSAAAVTTGDINGDGKPDVLVADQNGNAVLVLLNTAARGAITASFATEQSFGTGINPSSVATADVNGDGKLDLLTANSKDGTVSVLLNTTPRGAAAASFAAQQSFATGSGAQSVAVADVNGDGKPDLVVANPVSNNVSVLLGKGIGSFAAAVNYPAGDSPAAVAISDLDGDGKPDLAVANGSGNVVSLLRNTGSGVFAAALPRPALDNLSSIAVGDFNGDGRPDLVVNLADSSAVAVLLNPSFAGAGALGIAIGTGPRAIVTGDFNGDSKSDLAVANNSSNNVSVLLGNGDGTYAAAVNYTVGTAPVYLAIGDLNGDGKPDLAVANQSGSVSVLLGMSNGVFAAAVSYPDVGTLKTLAIGDLNGDNKPDLVVANNAGFYVLLNNGAGAFTVADDFTADGGIVALTDVNTDGRLDVVIAGSPGPNFRVFLNTTAAGATVPAFANAVEIAAGADTQTSIATGDLNGDGRPDLALGDPFSSNVVVHFNTTLAGAAAPSYGAPVYLLLGGDNPARTIAIGDLNGDGKPDLAVAAASTDNSQPALNPGGVFVLVNNGSGGFNSALGFPAGLHPYGVALGDLNGDGKLDIATANRESGNVSVLLAARDFAIPIRTSAGAFTRLLEMEVPDAAKTISGAIYPRKFFSFDITLPAGATKTRISIQLPAGMTANALVKCTAGVCRQLSGVTASTAGGITTLSYDLIDNGADGNDTNTSMGLLTDPVGAAMIVGSGGKGGAFGVLPLLLLGLMGLLRGLSLTRPPPSRGAYGSRAWPLPEGEAQQNCGWEGGVFASPA